MIRYPSFPVSIAKAPVPNVMTLLFEKKVKELGIELIHVHHPAIVGNVALYLKRKYQIPVVYTYHTRYEQYLYYVKPLERMERRTRVIERYLDYFCRKCDLLLAPTPGMKEFLQKSMRMCRFMCCRPEFPKTALPQIHRRCVRCGIHIRAGRIISL